ncbi:MAG: type IV pilus twitching motility protein PilT [Planctomycetota bacterium]|nr:MAG: type IV pilus twitching motility protein PilT [Planctomycetota bacterium]
MAGLDELLQLMARVGASDLHLSPGLQPLLRLHGRVVRHDKHPELREEQIANWLRAILPPRNRTELEEKLDTDFAYELDGVGRFRVNVFHDRLGTSAAFRLVPARVPRCEELGLPPVVDELCRLSKGLVVVTGPTGAGKSTTLAAMIDRINRTRSQHIITIEDPIEFVHPSQGCLVHQREVGRHALSFRRALRAALREDPDVLLVGEMRDLETMRSAIEMAATGHLVFGTLHTATAAGAVDRIIDQYPPAEQAQIRTMLADSLRAVVAQTLLRRKDGKGQVAAFEVLVVTPAVAAHVREGKTHAIASAIQTGTKYGMQTMGDAIAAHVVAGRVDPAEAYLKAVDKTALLARLHAAGIAFEPDGAEALAHASATPAAPAAPAAARRSGGGSGRSRRQAKAARFDDFETYRARRLGER